MKKFIVLFALLLKMGPGMAQAPNMINYQAVARNSAGNVLSNKTIGIRLSVLDGSSAGPVQYSETKLVVTNGNGLFNIAIGGAGAIATSGSYAGITWASGAKFLKVEMDQNSGAGYVTMGTQQLVSVPYAEHADQAGSLLSTAKINANQISQGTATNGQVLGFNGTSWAPLTLPNNGGGLSLPFSGAGSSLQNLGLFKVSQDGAGVGIQSTTMNGVGISSYSQTNTSIIGSSLSGTGVAAVSTSGTALNVSGNVKISGGITSPGTGKVLTSDAVGNAVWKDNRIAFSAYEYNPSTVVPHNGETKIQFGIEEFDYGNAFAPSLKPITASSGIFTAPKKGVYHFDAFVSMQGQIELLSVLQFTAIKIFLRIQDLNGGSRVVPFYGSSFQNNTLNNAIMNVNTDVKLLAGEKVYISVAQLNDESLPCTVNQARFNGHLVFEE